MKIYNLEERLIDYAVLILQIVKLLPYNNEGRILSNQLVKSGTSTALNYGEARASESRKDFIHKSSIILKELRESYVCMKIVNKSNMVDDQILLDRALKETNELISIFVSSINTAKRNMLNQKLL